MDATLNHPTTQKQASPPAAEPQPLSKPTVSGPSATVMKPGPTIHRTVRDDGICVLTFDRPDSSANVFDRVTLEELSRELDFIAGNPDIKGLVLVSAKKSIFIAGLDLHSINVDAPLADVRKLLEFGQSQISRIAGLQIPTAAAIHGAAVGGGCEITLACDYRIASRERATKIGLPEIQLGLLPAWGGATRLPRLVGLPKALSVILAGKTLAAKPALKLGLVDDLAPQEYLVDVAVRKIRQGKPQRSSHWLTNNGLAASIIANRARSQALKRTRGNYPAPLKALDVMARGISKPITNSLALEREGIMELVQTSACHNLLRLFFLQDNAKKRTLAQGKSDLKVKPVTRAAVIGAGVMGAGIAQWLSAKKLPVILRDINTEQVAKGMATIGKLYQDGVKRHAFTALEARHGLDRVYPAPSEVPLQNVDLVIEAAVENLELKKQIFQRLDALTTSEAVLATNTSALPVSELAATTKHPERVVGLHFFNPVHRMQLVEIIAAKQTSAETLERALRFTQKIGKLPVVVKDSPGFLVNRILMPYLIEAGSLFEAGTQLRDLDEAMLDFGMPMGPMRLIDEVGVDVSLHVAKTLAAHFSDRMQVPAILPAMDKAKLLGRKNGSGFYLHIKGKDAQPNPQAETFRRGNSAASMSRMELQERMVFLMVNEAARCLEEEIVTDPADVDFAMVMGTGFAPFHGGPLRYADQMGLTKLVGAMDLLADRGAEQFRPCAMLKDRAAAGGKFYQKG